MLHRPQSWDTFLPAAILAVDTCRSEVLKISPLHAPMGRLSKNPLQDLAAQMLFEDYTKVYKLVETNPHLEDRLESLSGSCDEA